jgi:hypothetical protein
MKLSELKINPKNPRICKDDRFMKLVKSIEEFPKMLKLRPIVVDGDNMVLGGNMRLKALQYLKYKEIPDEWVKRADELTDEEKQRFIAVDNVGFGEWDFDILANEWDKIQLEDWGVEILNYSLGHESNNMTEDDVNILEDFDPVGISKDCQRVVFIFDNSEIAENYLKTAKIDFVKRNMAWQVNMSSLSI